MSLFDAKNFNGEVFGTYVDQVKNLNRNQLIQSGAIVENNQYAYLLKDQAGGNYITVPIKARIKGTAGNYDGNTDITAESRKTYTQGRVVVGRQQGFEEKDFASDISGEDFLPATNEVAEFWDDVDQATLLAEMKGIFAMTGAKNLEFVNGHTYDISADVENGTFGPTTLNTAIQQALGDNKSKFSLAIMHSQVATNLENLKIVAYAKYNDADGMQRDVALATLNGRIVLIDDNMPTENVKAVPEKGNKGDDGYVAAQPAYTKYTTYVFGDGAIEYTNCGAKVPYEMTRDPKTAGGKTIMYARQRKCWAPYGISFKKPSVTSPSDEQLADGSNWELANSNESGTPEYFPHKAIPIARIITRG